MRERRWLPRPTTTLDSTTVAHAVTALREHGLLLEEHSAEADRDARIVHQWRSWEPEATFFHYATQDTHTAASLASQDPPEIDKLPALFTAYPDADRVLLPRYPVHLTAPLGEALYSRRTHRDFDDAPSPCPPWPPCCRSASPRSTTSTPTSSAQWSAAPALPAAPARNSTPMAITNVTGIPAGMYHYNSLEHSLELLSKGFTRQDTIDLCAGQDHFGGAAFLVLLVAVIERMRVKYRSPRCYRVSLLGAGHLGHTFALTATALGLGPFQTGAFHDAAVVERLGLNNTSRTPVYVLGAGHPNLEPDPERSPAPAGLDAFRSTPLT
ncbi:SagB/ThcOx family dehydrogenase [Streptomyces sp. NPDC051364]|uniref:SagB/ThcOx family dehydrogenase n=1 Tax=Streptomyces sp. NPDC051364 TaxID=3155799 RepID=UPI003430CB16